MADWPWYAKFRPIDQWPVEPTKNRRVAPFRAGWQATMVLLGRELEAVAAKQVVIQMAVSERDIRVDGFPRANARPAHPGIIVAFESRYGPLRYPCDTFDRWQDNLRAIALALEALRKVDRYGVTKRGEQYTGWKQIEAVSLTRREAAEFLVKVAYPTTDDEGRTKMVSACMSDPFVARNTWKAAAKKAHPDGGADRATWDRVSEARVVLGA